MYLKHFGLKRNPFLLSTSSGCVYYSQSQCEAIAQLLYAVRECKGIVLLTGVAGTGKTTLLHTVLNLVRPSGAVVSTILNPMMETSQELLSCDGVGRHALRIPCGATPTRATCRPRG
jgi:type II secretory pathway predicted ATPase ExeA